MSERTGILRYSHSLLLNQAMCPARIYYRQYYKEHSIPEACNIPMIVGSATHKGIEERLKFERNPMQIAQLYLQENLLDKYQEGTDYLSSELAGKLDLMSNCVNNFENHFRDSLRNVITDPESQVEVKLEVPWRKGILVGAVDVMLPELMADWKTGERVPSENIIAMQPQKNMYWYLAQQTGNPVPKEFVYVYLNGKNVNYKYSEKTKKSVPDNKNPNMKYSFATYPNEETVKEFMTSYAEPLALAYEKGIVYKNKSVMNCSGCLYKKVCDETSLPEVTE